MRLKDKIAIVVGAGQSPGEGMGNGRATVLRFVQEGAKVMAVDSDLASAEETAAMARQRAAMRGVRSRRNARGDAQGDGRVGAAALGPRRYVALQCGLEHRRRRRAADEITEEAFDRVAAINLRGSVMA